MLFVNHSPRTEVRRNGPTCVYGQNIETKVPGIQLFKELTLRPNKYTLHSHSLLHMIIFVNTLYYSHFLGLVCRSLTTEETS